MNVRRIVYFAANLQANSKEKRGGAGYPLGQANGTGAQSARKPVYLRENPDYYSNR
jgi:hypothetical protein